MYPHRRQAIRASSFIGLVLCTVADACSPAGTAPATTASITHRADTTLAGYVGEPVTWADSNIFPIAIDPLVDVGEPPLRGARMPSDQRVMRFTWVRSFHPTIVVRVIDLRTTCRIVTTVAQPRAIYLADVPLLDSSPTITGPAPKLRQAQVICRDSTEATPALCAELGEMLARAGLVRRPSAQPGGPDGAEWLLERADAQGHVARMNWTPNVRGDRGLYDAGIAFLRAPNALPTTLGKSISAGGAAPHTEARESA